MRPFSAVYFDMILSPDIVSFILYVSLHCNIYWNYYGRISKFLDKVLNKSELFKYIFDDILFLSGLFGRPTSIE